MGEMIHDRLGPKLKVIYLLEFEPNVSLERIADYMKNNTDVLSENYF